MFEKSELIKHIENATPWRVENQIRLGSLLISQLFDLSITQNKPFQMHTKKLQIGV